MFDRGFFDGLEARVRDYFARRDVEGLNVLLTTGAGVQFKVHRVIEVGALGVQLAYDEEQEAAKLRTGGGFAPPEVYLPYGLIASVRFVPAARGSLGFAFTPPTKSAGPT